jgi:hypothetical protein
MAARARRGQSAPPSGSPTPDGSAAAPVGGTQAEQEDRRQDAGAAPGVEGRLPAAMEQERRAARERRPDAAPAANQGRQRPHTDAGRCWWSERALSRTGQPGVDQSDRKKAAAWSRRSGEAAAGGDAGRRARLWRCRRLVEGERAIDRRQADQRGDAQKKDERGGFGGAHLPRADQRGSGRICGTLLT